MFVGVAFDESQDAWTAKVEVDGRVLYEDDYAFEEDAVLGREVALVKNGWEAERNFPGLELAGLCTRVAERLGKRLKGRSWHEWAVSVGLTPDEFLRLAEGEHHGPDMGGASP